MPLAWVRLAPVLTCTRAPVDFMTLSRLIAKFKLTSLKGKFKGRVNSFDYWFLSSSIKTLMTSVKLLKKTSSHSRMCCTSLMSVYCIVLARQTYKTNVVWNELWTAHPRSQGPQARAGQQDRSQGRPSEQGQSRAAVGNQGQPLCNPRHEWQSTRSE